jgi:hypothetical protein
MSWIDGCETCFHTLQEEEVEGVENKVLKGILWPKGGEITEEQKELHNEELCTVICTLYLMLLGWLSQAWWDVCGM